MMRFFGLAEYGGDELAIVTLACASVAYMLAWLDGRLALLALGPWLLVAWFFRDPQRSAPDDPLSLLAPADGTVTDIEELDESEFVHGRVLRIGIFLSPLNVHVNRAPCAGSVGFVKYKAGEFLPAYNPKAPTRNESVSLGLETASGLRVLVKQVSGLVARRIVCEAQPGDLLARGQRYGMIKFGSRTELYVPLDALARTTVALGDKVKGGISVCCKLAVSRGSAGEIVVGTLSPDNSTAAGCRD